MFIAALLMITKIWKQLVSTDRRMNKESAINIHTYVYTYILTYDNIPLNIIQP